MFRGLSMHYGRTAYRATCNEYWALENKSKLYSELFKETFIETADRKHSVGKIRKNVEKED